MPRVFTKQICLFITEQMHTDLKKLSKKGFASISHLIRTAIREFLESEANGEARPQGNGLVNNEERKEDSYA